MNWMISMQGKFFALFLVTSWHSVFSEYQPSIYWSPADPRFKFSQEDLKNNQAFLQKFVSPESNVMIICPNIATITSRSEYKPVHDNLYENIWIVNQDEFLSCGIDIKHKDSRLLHICDKPDQLNFYTINFTQLLNTLQENSNSIYFIATSNGSKTSLNQTSGGHCIDTQEGFSLRIKFTLCQRNSTETGCESHMSPTKNDTATAKTCKNDSALNARSSKTNDDAAYLWKVLAICLGVVLGISLLIVIAVFMFICLKRRKRQESIKKPSEEPMKTLIVEPYKSKHVKVSAAL